MIKSFRIRNLATIEDLELCLGEGFSILTGETGAGKSIIIDAIRLLLGDKASADMIRTGKKECLIEAVFDTAGMPSEGREGFPPGEESEVCIQRQIIEQGTGKAYINGVLSPVRKLRELGPHLVDIYGQNDHVFLLNLENHLRYLDGFADQPDLVLDVRKAAQALRALLQEKRSLEDRLRQRDERLDFLDFQIREIENGRLKPGEDAELLEARGILKNAEKITALVDKALDIAYQDENSLLPLLARCRAAIEELSSMAPSFLEFRQGLEESAILVRDLADSLARFRDRRTETPGTLEDIEARLSLIEKLKRKHGGSLGTVLDRLEAMKEEKAALAASRERLDDLERDIEKKFLDYAEGSRRLGTLRAGRAEELGRLIEKEIALLGMKKAKFEVRVSSRYPTLEDPDSIRDSGTDEAEFVFSPNPGEEMRPLRKIASGGELSRIMLALKAIGEESENRKTLIFDEIDAGIGGKTAECIALRLLKLSRRHQVLCITHLPQIASAATHHFRVDKKIEKERTYTTISGLSLDERPEEIARLIAGSRITKTSLETAMEMLDRYPAKGRAGAGEA